MLESLPRSEPERDFGATVAGILAIERDLGLALGHAQDMDAALTAILEAALRLPPFDGGGVYVFEADGSLALRVHRGLGQAFVDEARYVPPGDPRIAVVQNGRPIFAPYPQVAQSISPVGRAEGIRALAVVPVRDGDATVAVVNVASHTSDTLPEVVCDALLAIASRIGALVSRVRAEAGRRQVQENFQALFDSLNDFLFILDEGGCIVHANSVVLRRLGYTLDELLGQPVLAVHPPERGEEALRIVGEMLAGANTYCPIPLRTKDGSHIPVETVVSRGTWDGRSAILGISRDIARRLDAEAALQASEQMHRAIVENSPVGMARLDLAGRYVQVNPAFAAMLGYAGDTVGELIGRDFIEITHPADRPSSLDRLQALVRGDFEARSLEKRYLHRSGREVWSDTTVLGVRGPDGELAFILSLCNDITDRKRVEAAHAEIERQFREMADAAPVLIWLADAAGRRTFFNQTWHSFTGRTRIQELGEGWLSGVHPDDRAAVAAATRGHASADAVEAREYRLRGADGQYRWLLERSGVRHDATGTYAGMVGSCTDITDRKRVETEREQLVHELQGALATVKTLRGLIPVCAWCKKMRNDQGYWSQIEVFLRENSDAQVSHGICPDCLSKMCPDAGETASGG